jgi:hypothetical protein
MNKYGLRNWFFRCLLLTFAFAQVVACTSSSNTTTAGAAVLIVYDTSGDTEEMTALTTLNTIMTAAGYTVTESVGIPSGDLSGYIQIWDIRYDVPISDTDEANYLTYVAGGGTLALTGEYPSSSGRDSSIITLIDQFGGGTIILTTPSTVQTVQPAFTVPNTVSSVRYWDPAVDGLVDGTTTPGAGTFITKDTSGYGSAIYYAPGMLSNATAGSLIVVFDTNFLNPNNSDYADFYNLTGNMLAL